MSQNKHEWVRREGIQHDINDLMEDFTTNRPMTNCLEDFAVRVWNKAIKEAQDTADETDTDADPAKAIAELEVGP